MDSRDLRIILNAQDKASGVIKGAASKIQGSLNSMGQSVASAGKTMTAALTLPIVAFGVKSVQAFMSQELASTRLANSFRQVGGITKETAAAMEQYASQLQATTTFSDENITSGMALLGTFAMTTDQVKTLTPAMLDAATALEKTTGQSQDLEQIATQVGKAVSTGNLGMLKRWGLTLSESALAAFELADTQGRVNILTEAFAQNYGGQAAAAAQTLTGKWRQMKNELNDAMEPIGKIILEYLMPMIGRIKELAIAFKNMSPEQQKFIVQLLAGVAAAGPLLIVLGKMITGLSSVVGFVVKAGSVIGLLFTTWWAIPLLIIIGIIAALGAAWVQHMGCMQKAGAFLWERLKPIFEKIKEWLAVHIPIAIAFLKRVWDMILPHLIKAWEILKIAFATAWNILKSGWELVKPMLVQFWEQIKPWAPYIKYLFYAIIAVMAIFIVISAMVIGAIIIIVVAVANMVAGIINLHRLLFEHIVWRIQQIPAKWRETCQYFINAWNTVKNFVINAWNIVVNQFWKGVNAIKNFFGGIYNAIADPFRRAFNYVLDLYRKLRNTLTGAGWGVGAIMDRVLPRFQRGGYVWQDGPVMAHAGERIVTKNEANNQYNNAPTIIVQGGNDAQDTAWILQRQLERVNYGSLWR
jgi:phage-related protein